MAENKYKQPNWQLLKDKVVITKNNAEDAAQRLAEKRKTLNATIERLTDSFEASNAELISEVAELDNVATLADTELRAAMITDYEARKEKQIFDGLSIRLNKAYEYDDGKAVAFAIERKMPELLVPNKTAFKKQMSITPQPFCEVIETPTAVVSFKEKG